MGFSRVPAAKVTCAEPQGMRIGWRMRTRMKTSPEKIIILTLGPAGRN